MVWGDEEHINELTRLRDEVILRIKILNEQIEENRKATSRLAMVAWSYDTEIKRIKEIPKKV